jgi:undecaprenyl-diphosphatase
MMKKATAWIAKRLASPVKRPGMIVAVFIGLFLLVLGPHAVLTADVALFEIINGHHTPFFDEFFFITSFVGSGWIVIPAFLVIILWRTPKNKRAFIVLVAAAALSLNALCNSVVKQVVGRPRPSSYFRSQRASLSIEEQRTYGVHVVGQKLNDHSFPSGHTNTIFAVATLLVLAFGRNAWPAYIFALMVAYSRVYVGAHFPLDTLAGALLGIVIGLAVWRVAAAVQSARRKK